MDSNKRRGDKHHGRGHRKNGSGRRGGTGRAGWNKHKLMSFIKPTKKSKRKPYIKAEYLIANLEKYTSAGSIIYKDEKYHVFTKQIPKILNKKILPLNYELHN